MFIFTKALYGIGVFRLNFFTIKDTPFVLHDQQGEICKVHLASTIYKYNIGI